MPGAQAQATQDANRAATNRMPPAWAIAAMVVLGFNEFLALLYNPLYIVLGLAIFLFARTVYQARPAESRMIVHIMASLVNQMSVASGVIVPSWCASCALLLQCASLNALQ